jgi:hypothetical protein
MALTIPESSAFVASVAIAAALVFVCMLMSLADLRYSVIRLSTELYKADHLIKHMPVTPHSNTAQSIVRYIAKRKLNSFSVGVLNDAPATRHILDEEDERATSARTPTASDNDPSAPSLLNAFHMFANIAGTPRNARVIPTAGASSETAGAAAMAGMLPEENELDLERNDVARSVKAFFVSEGAMPGSEKE